MEFRFPVLNTSYGESDCIGSVSVEADTLDEAESKAMVAAWENLWDDGEIISIRIDSSLSGVRRFH